jgi:hypothetical protein
MLVPTASHRLFLHLHLLVKFLSCLGHLDFASVQVIDALVIVTDVLEGLLYYTLSF